MVDRFPDNNPKRPIGDDKAKKPIEKPQKPIFRPIEKPIEKPIERPIEKPCPMPDMPEKPGTKEAMLREIMEYQFIIYDIALYLDTHPNDPRAHEAHKKYTKELHDLRRTYEETYGPLSLMSPYGDYAKYVNEPWPWEIRF